MTLLITGALMLPFYMLNPAFWHSAFSMLYRLKFFFISIVLVYVFLSPVSFSEMSDIKILLDVLLPGLFRIAVLITIIFAVNFYLKTTTKEQILASLLWCFKFLHYFKINIDRVALRAVMTLEYIEYLNNKLTKYQHKQQQERQKAKQLKTSYKQMYQSRKTAFFNLVSQSGIILQEVLHEAEQTSDKHYNIDCLQRPVLMQFMIPVVVSILLYLTV